MTAARGDICCKTHTVDREIPISLQCRISNKDFVELGCHAPREREHISTRHCEKRSDEAIHSSFTPRDGLPRFARNDDLSTVIAWLDRTTSIPETLAIERKTAAYWIPRMRGG
jgi:hypothetical protein